MILNKDIKLVNKRYAVVTESENNDSNFVEIVDVDTLSANEIDKSVLEEYKRYGTTAYIDTIKNIIEDENSNNYFLYEWTVVETTKNPKSEYITDQERISGRILYQSNFGMDRNLFMDYFLYSKEADLIVDDDDFLEFMASNDDDNYLKTFLYTDDDDNGIYTYITFIIRRTKAKMDGK